MIKVIITGGTIDKHYNVLNGQLLFTQSQIPKMMEIAGCTTPIVYQHLMLIDSLDMTDLDRDKINQSCALATEQQIIITHGTDTMIATAHSIANHFPDKTIVLTGAMVPFSFGHSDALFNLGLAISAVQILSPGIYIAMNGQIFDFDKVEKIKHQGLFQSLLNEQNPAN